MNQLVCLFAEETTTLATSAWLEQAVRMPLAWAVALSALGIFLCLPQGGRRRRWLGLFCGLAALGLLTWYGLSLGDWVEDLVFRALAGITVFSAAATICTRNPLYSSIWFALVLLGTGGLFVYQGAQFLGVATIVVYAGAILVTFLFVLMLAQPDGVAYYDRMSWEPLLSAVAGSVLIGLLTGAILQTTQTPLTAKLPEFLAERTDEQAETLQQPASDPTTATVAISPNLPVGAEQSDLTASGGVLNKDHVATLGQEMFSRRLIAVQVSAALLLAALVGAAAIVIQGKKLPQVDPHAQQHGSGAHV